MILGFIEGQRAKGRAVESVCQVLRSQGVQIAARTYRAWKNAGPSMRDVSDAVIVDALRSTAGTPESMYGRRKMTAWLRNLANKLLGRLWWCLKNNQEWDEEAAWGALETAPELLAA